MVELVKRLGRPTKTEVGWSELVTGSTVSYSLPVDAHTRISVYDARGGFVTMLVDEPKLAGEHSIAWDGRDRAGVEVATGIYFVRLESNNQFRTRKILLLK